MRQILVEQHGVEVGHLKVTSPDGAAANEIFLIRMVGGKRRCLPAPVFFEDDEFLTATTIRYICKHLGLQAKSFGLSLG